MELVDFNRFTPLGAVQFIELLEPAEQTASGIYLPETARENLCEAVIKRSGLGWHVPSSDTYALAWVQPTYRIVLQRHAFQPLYRGSRLGFVQDDSILGTIAEDRFSPLNDWVMVSLEDWVEQETGSDILVPDGYQRRPQRGKVLDWGPGRMISKGALIGCRLTIPTTLQLSPAEFSDAVVWWDSDSDVVELGRESVEFLLVRSAHLIGIEVSDG